MKLKSAARKAMPASEFGLPGRRAYPMPDKSHAANAKARATQMVKAGKLSSAAASRIRAKANQMLRSGKLAGKLPRADKDSAAGAAT